MKETILIVDNEQELLDLYRETLEAEGYEVITSLGGRPALEILWHRSVDMTVLELALDDGFGLEYLQKYLFINRDMKILIHTFYPIYPMEFKTWLADAYLMKSPDLARFRKAVKDTLNAPNVVDKPVSSSSVFNGQARRERATDFDFRLNLGRHLIGG